MQQAVFRRPPQKCDRRVKVLQRCEAAQGQGARGATEPGCNALEQSRVQLAARRLVGLPYPDNQKMGRQRDDYQRGDDQLDTALCFRAAKPGPEMRPGQCGHDAGHGSSRRCGADVHGVYVRAKRAAMMPLSARAVPRPALPSSSGDVRLDQLRQQLKRFLPAQVTGFCRNDARNAFLHDAQLDAA